MKSQITNYESDCYLLMKFHCSMFIKFEVYCIIAISISRKHSHGVMLMVNEKDQNKAMSIYVNNTSESCNIYNMLFFSKSCVFY